MLTPEQVHFGQAASVIARRQAVLDSARAARPERFVGGPPKLRRLPDEVWINGPAQPDNPFSIQQRGGFSKSFSIVSHNRCQVLVPLQHSWSTLRATIGVEDDVTNGNGTEGS